MADKGDDWQALKVADLMTVFGESTVLGARGEVVRNAPDGYRSAVFGASSLLDHLTSSPPPGTFIVEGGFAPRNGVFDKTWSLEWCADLELEWGELRPDIIQVADPGLFAEGLLPDGSICDLTGDDRVVLRVIDAKLSSEPGRGYYAEVAYYAVALAAWLNHMGLDDRYVVAAAPALWPGSHNQSALIEAWRADADGDELLEALNADLEECPIDVFIPELHRFFTQVLPRVARSAVSREWAQLPWHVVQSCSGCDYLGQRLPDGSKATGPSRPHANHCIPTARETDHVSMLPYVPRGGTTVLQEAGVTTTSNVALLSRDDPKLDEHHALRAGRAIIPARARTLTGQQPPGIGVADATTAAIPRRADLNLYITADFDPTSAITACFGVSGVYFPTWADQQNGAEPRFLRTAVYHVEARTLEEERTQLDLLLKQIDHQLTAAHGNNPEASFQLYLWDELTLKHLTRVIGRHLDWLLASGSAPRLAWLFPPEDQVLANPRFVQSPAVSVVADAVRSLVATDQPHAYTLLETAREYHSAREAVDERTFQAPAYWTTQLSDQLPGERIFELWNSDTQRFHTPKTQLIENLAWTVKAKHRALQAVVRRLREDLNGQLHREAPQIKHLQPPGSAGAMSYLGSLLVWYSKLNHAINLQETVRVRAMAPHEREARFATIYCEEFLTGDAAKDAAAHLNLSVVPGRRFYKMRPASAEVRAEVGDFTWFASPADNPELVHTSLYWAVREKGLLGEGWWVNKPPYLNSWESRSQRSTAPRASWPST